VRSRRLETIIRSIGRRFPGTRVLVEPFVSPDGGRDIHWWLYVVDVPARWRDRVGDFATRKGCEVYGSPSRIPFFLSVHTVRRTPATVSWWEERMRRFREWRSARAAAGRRRRLREQRLRVGRVSTASPRRRGVRGRV
jgi:hypothetical protein